MACCLSQNKEDCKDFTFDYQFEGFSNHGKSSIPEQSFCSISEAKDEGKPEYQDELDQKVADEGKIKVINELDRDQWDVHGDNFSKFLSDFDVTYMDRSRPKGPDYLVMDNFLDIF